MDKRRIKKKVNTDIDVDVEVDQKSIENTLDEIRTLTHKSKSDLKDLYEKACQEAFDTIVSDSKTQIHNSARRGYERCYLYFWHYVENIDDERFKFCGIRILDIVTKGDLISRLNQYFNPQDEKDGYYVSWHKFKQTNFNKQSKYGIYVSWRKRDRERYREESKQESEDEER